ncbi:hypothetical protein RND81_05G035300 [Saponaria officinalis]|uniref:Pectinesterase inhibitor domain-containing protein n=1 Tax=Saponaria officinalis TaxID=3572 RepID=A0AAW1KQI7_SAPOF
MLPHKYNPSLICIQFLAIVNLAIAPIANGDGPLIANICNKSPYPRECAECIFKNPNATQMGTHELVGVVEYCTYDLAGIVQRSFDDQATMATDAYARDRYTDCSKSIMAFSNAVATAMTLWWNRNDPSAKQNFNSAKTEYDNCKLAIGELNQSRGIPSDVSDLFIKLSFLYQDTYAIMLKS